MNPLNFCEEIFGFTPLRDFGKRRSHVSPPGYHIYNRAGYTVRVELWLQVCSHETFWPQGDTSVNSSVTVFIQLKLSYAQGWRLMSHTAVFQVATHINTGNLTVCYRFSIDQPLKGEAWLHPVHFEYRLKINVVHMWLDILEFIFTFPHIISYHIDNNKIMGHQICCFSLK